MSKLVVKCQNILGQVWNAGMENRGIEKTQEYNVV